MMKFYRQMILMCACVYLSSAIKEEEIEYPAVKDPPVHPNMARSVHLFSKGPEEDAPKVRGWDRVRDHWWNIVKGGTVGLEVNPKKHLPKLYGLWEKIRKFFPGTQRYSKRSGDLPPSEPDEPRSGRDGDFDFVGTGFINPRVRPQDVRRDRLEAGDENALK